MGLCYADGTTMPCRIDPANPNSRKDFVLLECGFEVKDHVTQAAPTSAACNGSLRGTWTQPHCATVYSS